MGRVKVKIHRGRLEARLMYLSQKAANNAAENYKTKIQSAILQSGRIDTGRMVNDINVVPAPLPFMAVAKVIPMTEHFLYQDRGTKGSEARPGSALRFKPKGSTVYIFRKKTGPIPPGNFILKARALMSPMDYVS